MAQFYFFVCTLLTLSSSFHGISAVNYQVTLTDKAAKTPGGARFTKEIGIPFTKQLMGTINNFIWNTILKQTNPSDRKPVPSMTINIVDFKGAEAITSGEIINVSSVYLLGYKGNLKWEFTSLLYHEMTHVFQWNGEGKAPVGLVEGIADYTILKANYFPPLFAKAGSGDKWDQGYDFTARFLEYCDGLVPGFVAKLNAKIKKSYDANYFKELTGKPVDQLWKEYKAKYKH